MSGAVKDIQELSDEEFLKEFENQQAAEREAATAASEQGSDPGVPDDPQASAPEGEDGKEPEGTGGADPGTPDDTPSDGGEASTSEESTPEGGNDEPDDGDEGGRSNPHQGEETDDPKPKSESKPTSPDSTEAEQLAQLLAPLKAAKRTIEVGSVDKARQLMQMGVDYSRKMADMKPYQRMMTSLERADLLDEDKLNFLIDLSKKRPEAIKKLLKDSDIDPLDLDLEDSESYRPNDHMVPEGELAVDQVLDAIRPSPKFNDVVNTVQAWDTASKRILMDKPEVLHHLTAHMEAGIYDMVMDRLESDRIFGKHAGLSDLDAYKAVGDAMHEEGAFSKGPNAPVPSTPSPTDQGSSQEPKGSPDDSARNAKRLAATSPKGGPGKVQPQLPDISKMNDDEFMKYMETYDWKAAG